MYSLYLKQMNQNDENSAETKDVGGGGKVGQNLEIFDGTISDEQRKDDGHVHLRSQSAPETKQKDE